MPSTGSPASNTAWGARGAASADTLAGPPDRMNARAPKPAMRAGSASYGQTSQ